MVLRYLAPDAGSGKNETTAKPATKNTMLDVVEAVDGLYDTSSKTKTKRRTLICLLLLGYLIVANTGYNLWAAEENTPIWKILTANVIYDLWTKNTSTARKNTSTEPGVVIGILYSIESPAALINREVVYEGDITNDVKVVKIDRTKVEFEKNGKIWTQKVLANPNHAWKQQNTLQDRKKSPRLPQNLNQYSPPVASPSPNR